MMIRPYCYTYLYIEYLFIFYFGPLLGASFRAHQSKKQKTQPQDLRPPGTCSDRHFAYTSSPPQSAAVARVFGLHTPASQILLFSLA